MYITFFCFVLQSFCNAIHFSKEKSILMKHRKLEVNHNDVIYLQYQNLEKGFERCPQNEDMMQYLYLKAGNPV